MLLVGDDQPQPPEGYPFTEQRMGSHNQVQRPRGQGRPAVSLLGGGHGAHQKPHPKACPRQKGFHGPLMLLGQQLRGGHQRRLTAVLPGKIGAGRGHHRLARAHVPLQQAVHGNSPPQIRRRFLHRPQLGRGEGKRQPAGKCLQVLPHKGTGPLFSSPSPNEGQTQVQAEQLLKHQPPPSLGQGLPRSGKMNAPIGLLHRDQIIGLPQVVPQGLLHLGQAGQPRPDQPREKPVGDPRS